MARAKAQPKAAVVEPATIDPMDIPPRVYADHEAHVGHFATVVKGPHQGLYGVVVSFGDLEADGRPKTAVLETRDDNGDRYNIDYDHLRPTTAGRR